MTIFRREWSWLKRLLFLSAATGGGAWETVTGAIASFFATKAKPVKLSFLLNPIQAGSGDPSPENVRAISGHDGATVYRTGVNVWDEVFEVGGIDTTTGANVSSDNTGRSKNYISIVPNTMYYRKASSCADSSVFITYFYDKNKNFLSYTGSSNTNPSVFTTPSNAYFMRFVTKAVYGTTYNDDISINFPATATEYEPFNGASYPVTFPSVVYGGEVDWNAGKLKNVFAYVSKKYSELANSSGTTPEGYSLKSIDISSAVGDYVNATSAICNLAKYNASSNAQNVFRITSTGKYIMLTLPTDTDADTEIVVCYPLATPTEVSLSDLDSIVPVVGVNNVWVDNSDNISVEYFGVNT